MFNTAQSSEGVLEDCYHGLTFQRREVEGVMK